MNRWKISLIFYTEPLFGGVERALSAFEAGPSTGCKLKVEAVISLKKSLLFAQDHLRKMT